MGHEEYRAALERIALAPGCPKKIYNIAADALRWAREFDPSEFAADEEHTYDEAGIAEVRRAENEAKGLYDCLMDETIIEALKPRARKWLDDNIGEGEYDDWQLTMLAGELATLYADGTDAERRDDIEFYEQEHTALRAFLVEACNAVESAGDASKAKDIRVRAGFEPAETK